MSLLGVALLPGVGNLADLGSVAAVALGLTGLGRLAARRLVPELQLLTGWGIACLILTVWGCVTPLTLAIPATGLAIAGLVGVLAAPRRPNDGLWRVGVLSLPIWLVMASATPSQVDTWLNLLPNAAYLVDHGVFPRADRPESYSFIPVAPYNTQFVTYAASLLRGELVGNSMGSFNILLQCAAAGLFARKLAGDTAPIGWTAAALGLLLAVPLNPGFIPRAFFAPYGEAPIAVTTAAAAWLLAAAIEGRAPGARRDAVIGLAAVLAALVNIKQSAIGMVISVAAAGFFALWRYPDERRLEARRAGVLVLALLPALALYALWRWYATASFAVGELKALPLSQWNIALLPQILAGVAHAIAQKGVYFVTITVLLIGTVWRGRGDAGGGGLGMVLACLAAAIILGDNAFIIFTYIAHFEPSWAVQAHSYFRYMAQLSLLVMLGLIVLLRPALAAGLAATSAPLRRLLSGVAVVTILVAPLAFIGYLRFDREAPQPQIDTMVRAIKPQLSPTSGLAILVPGDLDDLGGSYLRGLVLYAPPRGFFPAVTTRNVVDRAALDRLAADGYRQALLSCSDLARDLPGLPRHALVLLRYTGKEWSLAAAQPYPPGLGRRHWAGLLPKPIFCGDLS